MDAQKKCAEVAWDDRMKQWGALGIDVVDKVSCPWHKLENPMDSLKRDCKKKRGVLM
jgi:Zn ribbon nucleic-acid-binding protein